MTMTKHEFNLQHGQPIFRGGRYLYPDAWQVKWDDDATGRFKEPPFDDDELEALQAEYKEAELEQQLQAVRNRGESFDDFARRQGCPSRLVKGRHVFANGATHEGPGTFGIGTEPTAELFPRLRLREEYLRAALADEEQAFHRFRKHCVEAASNATRFTNCVSPSQDAVPQLEAGRQRVLVLRGELADVLEKLGESPEVQGLRRAHETAMKGRQDANDLYSKLNSIQI